MFRKRKTDPDIEAPKQRELLQTAAGGSASGSGGLKAGQNVICRIVRAEMGGYAVDVPKHGPGFLPTPAKLKIGEEILAQFVCIYDKRIFVSARLAAPTENGAVEWVSWDDFSDEEDSV